MSTGRLNFCKSHNTPDTAIKTTVSKLYDALIFIDTYNFNDSEKHLLFRGLIFNNLQNIGACILMKQISSSWSSGSSPSGSNNYSEPYIEYGVAPQSYVKYRMNEFTLERYITSSNISINSNPDFQLIMKYNTTYKIYGIDFIDDLNF